VRALLEAAVGPNTSGEHRGYVAVLSHGALVADATHGDKPAEQWANIAGSVIAFADDFDTQRRAPLSSAKLRHVSGGNTLTAARKNKGENVFLFNVLLVICATDHGCKPRHISAQMRGAAPGRNS
jgi:hypothetical protein